MQKRPSLLIIVTNCDKGHGYLTLRSVTTPGVATTQRRPPRDYLAAAIVPATQVEIQAKPVLAAACRLEAPTCCFSLSGVSSAERLTVQCFPSQQSLGWKQMRL